MSFGAIRSALRLYKPRLVPKSRISRYGLATVVAAGIGMAYTWRRIEQSIWSDDLKPDPPLPPQYEFRYRLGAWLAEVDMPANAWDMLAELWQRSLNDGADAAVVAAIAVKLLQVGAPADVKHVVATQSLHGLLGTGWDTVQPRERERAVMLALSASHGVDQTAGWPFLQWAWAQAWHIAVLDVPQSPTLDTVTQLVDASSKDHVLEVLPFALVIADRSEERRKERGLDPMQQCLLSLLYSRLGMFILWYGIETFTTAAQCLVRALSVLEPPADLVLERKVSNLYQTAFGRVYFPMGMLYELMSHFDHAQALYKRAHNVLPQDDALKDLAHTYMLRAELRLKSRKAAESSEKT